MPSLRQAHRRPGGAAQASPPPLWHPAQQVQAGAGVSAAGCALGPETWKALLQGPPAGSGAMAEWHRRDVCGPCHVLLSVLLGNPWWLNTQKCPWKQCGAGRWGLAPGAAPYNALPGGWAGPAACVGPALKGTDAAFWPHSRDPPLPRKAVATGCPVGQSLEQHTGSPSASAVTPGQSTDERPFTRGCSRFGWPAALQEQDRRTGDEEGSGGGGGHTWD